MNTENQTPVFEIALELTFKGTVRVQARTAQEAHEIAQAGFGAVLGTPHSSDDRILDWDVNTHPEKTTSLARKTSS